MGFVGSGTTAIW